MLFIVLHIELWAIMGKDHFIWQKEIKELKSTNGKYHSLINWKKSLQNFYPWDHIEYWSEFQGLTPFYFFVRSITFFQTRRRVPALREHMFAKSQSLGLLDCYDCDTWRDLVVTRGTQVVYFLYPSLSDRVRNAFETCLCLFKIHLRNSLLIRLVVFACNLLIWKMCRMQNIERFLELSIFRN